ncbi:MAG: GlsB/YeaQ/YmgE family stress response membrane protein [Rhizobium sp.]|nr:GlsB/YeaQ/YmgE family stress response membrane protein [Rhizobium sp.]
MDLNGVGILGAIVIGGVAGWLAEMFMKSNMGLIMNIILGIVGAALLNFVLAALGVYTGSGWLVYLIVGFAGACILIAIGRMIRR